MCYRNVGCSFDLVCCLCAIRMSVDYLIRFAACHLLEVGCLFDWFLCSMGKSVARLIRFAAPVL